MMAAITMSAIDPKRTSGAASTGSSAVLEKGGRLLQRPENSFLLVAIPTVVVMVVVARIIGVIAMMVVVMMIAVMAMMVVVMMIVSCSWDRATDSDCADNAQCRSNCR